MTTMEAVALNNNCIGYQLPDIRDAGMRPRVETQGKSLVEMLGAALKPSTVLPIAAMVGMSALMVWGMIHFRETLENLGNWRYAGIFFAELGNSAAVLFPTPGPAYTLTMAAMLNPLLVGVIGGIAASLGELTGYFIGMRGRKAIEGSRFQARFQALAGKHAGFALFAFALFPLPFDFAGLWAGSVRYPVSRFLGYLAMGKIVKLTVVAMAASYGFQLFS